MPNVVLEALACGTPVIATPAPGGVFELLENRDGCVIADAVTAESLAKSIMQYPFRQVGKEEPRAAYDLSAFSVERITAHYARLFSDVVGLER